MRFDEALGINIWTSIAMACLVQVCAWWWCQNLSHVLSDILFGMLLFLCGCIVGLCHICLGR